MNPKTVFARRDYRPLRTALEADCPPGPTADRASTTRSVICGGRCNGNPPASDDYVRNLRLSRGLRMPMAPVGFSRALRVTRAPRRSLLIGSGFLVRLMRRSGSGLKI